MARISGKCRGIEKSRNPRLHLAAIALIAALTLPLSAGRATSSFVPPDGFIPRAEIAIGVARAVLQGVYGVENIKRQEPLVAERRGSTWFVHGTPPKGYVGGTAEIVIDAKDGHILHVIHTK